MTKDREIALEQALMSVVGAAAELGMDLKALSEKANLLTMDHSPYRRVDHPYVTTACGEIGAAVAQVLQIRRH